MQTLPSSKSEHSSKIADELTHLLADTYTLSLKTQNFHWNVTGPLFHSYHLMFEAQYKDLAEAVDEIAERIRALNCYTPASFADFLKLTSLKEESQKNSAEDMVKKLLKDHETIIAEANTMLTKAQKAQDEATMDLLIERIREHEKTAWMLRSSVK